MVGAVLSVLFAKTRPKMYRSSATLYYQEHIQTSLLQNRSDAATLTRNIGERYRELLMARSSLVEIVRNPEVNPYPDILAADGEEAAVEELRMSVDFRPRGANTFVIGYTDKDPDRAKLVAEHLTELLRNKAAQMQLDSAQATAQFATQLRSEAIAELRERQKKLNEFLVQHTEFVLDTAAGQSAEGAGIRAAKEAPKPSASSGGGGGSSVLGALERQRARIKARIDNPTAPMPAPEPRVRTRTAAQQAADAKVAEIEREVAGAQRRLEDVQQRFTDKHPDVVKAKDTLAAAQQRLKLAKAAVPPDVDDLDDPVAALPADPAALQRELAEIERQIAAERARLKGATVPATGSGDPATSAATVASSVVKLEDDYQQLKLDVDQQKQRVNSLADSSFRSQLEAQQRLAEQGESLSVVDSAFRPMQPTGKPKKMLVLVGIVVFTMLGAALACGLALLDDRIYKRGDLEVLTSTVPVLATIPRAARKRRFRIARSKPA